MGAHMAALRKNRWDPNRQAAEGGVVEGGGVIAAISKILHVIGRGERYVESRKAMWESKNSMWESKKGGLQDRGLSIRECG